MKRLIAAAILALIISAVHFTGNIYIKSVIDKSNNLLEECIVSYQKEAKPTESAERLKNFWSENEDLMSVFAHHDNIDEIEHAIDTLAVYSSTEDSEIFYEYSGTVKTLLHQLYEDNSLTMHSVL